MNPNNFSNSNSADDSMPMFGSAHWPGHEDYRVQTPGSVESTMDPEGEFDPFFNTDSYRAETIEPSCGQPPAPTPIPKPKKKRMAQKDKALAVPLPTSEVNNQYAEGSVDYEYEEFKTLGLCWIDISEDPITSNNQPFSGYWDRIVARYSEVRLTWAYKWNKDQLCKAWDRMKKHINDFKNIYKRAKDARASGENMEDVLHKALVTYQMQFKFYNVWLMLKDKPKFDDAIEMSGSKRTKNTASDDYTSRSGPPPVDLNEEPVASYGTPTSTFRRPVGRKATIA